MHVKREKNIETQNIASLLQKTINVMSILIFYRLTLKR